MVYGHIDDIYYYHACRHMTWIGQKLGDTGGKARITPEACGV